MKRGLRSLGWAVLALLLLAAVFHTAILTAAGTYLVRAEAPQQADIGFVLAGDAWGNRIRTAGDLVRSGYIPKVVVSGPSGTYGYHECDLAIPFAVKAGYPESYFLHFENEARSTDEEARAAAVELAPAGCPQGSTGHQRLPHAAGRDDVSCRCPGSAIRCGSRSRPQLPD